MNRVHYNVRMIRPDTGEVVERDLLRNEPVNCMSDRQLAGYLTHTIIPQDLHGGPGTYYQIVERAPDSLRAFNVVRTEDGRYRRV